MTIARWRHLVRVLVRLVAAPLIIFGTILLALAMLRTGLSILEGGGFTVTYLIYANLVPIIIVTTGILLVMFDRRLAKLIVPMPTPGCPGCGYWIGDREMQTCPECGLRLAEEAS